MNEEWFEMTGTLILALLAYYLTIVIVFAGSIVMSMVRRSKRALKIGLLALSIGVVGEVVPRLPKSDLEELIGVYETSSPSEDPFTCLVPMYYHHQSYASSDLAGVVLYRSFRIDKIEAQRGAPCECPYASTMVARTAWGFPYYTAVDLPCD